MHCRAAALRGLCCAVSVVPPAHPSLESFHFESTPIPQSNHRTHRPRPPIPCPALQLRSLLLFHMVGGLLNLVGWLGRRCTALLQGRAEAGTGQGAATGPCSGRGELDSKKLCWQQELARPGTSLACPRPRPPHMPIQAPTMGALRKEELEGVQTVTPALPGYTFHVRESEERGRAPMLPAVSRHASRLWAWVWPCA